MNDRSGVYVPPGNRDRTGGSSSGSKLEDTLAKVLQKVESTDAGVKEMKGDFSSISQLVDSHTTSTKQIEQQLGKLSASLNQRKNGSLPSDTIQNPKKDGYCMAITTRSDKILIEPIFAGTKIPRPTPPFTKRLKKKAEDGKFAKFIIMLRQLSVNIPLVEALEKILGYAKFMKDLVIKKRAVSFELIDNIHHCSVIASRSLVRKNKDPGAFTIPCTIGSFVFAKALCDLGASINLMLLAIEKQLDLVVPKPTAMRLMMADKSVKWPVCRASVDIESGELKFRLNNEEVKFNICRSMKQPQDMNVVSTIDVFDEEESGASIEERFVGGTLEAVLMNFEADFGNDYVETKNAL
ncbi:uncharacterized protein [Solanum tuberosum]|uniref:uncharacterized protein n=1 Tax=Solanum tuberosum TaxID=4113 RepID=UPI00073A4C5E|nr:PREDICTED: uncharacterized protein LOC107059714 [Solanum tuberosum]